MLTNNWPGMWKEINSQLGVFLNIMNITGPSVYNGRTWFTLLHMAEAPHWTLNLLQHPSPPPGSDKGIYLRIWKILKFGWTVGGDSWVICHCWCCDVGEATRKTQRTSYGISSRLLPLTLCPHTPTTTNSGYHLMIWSHNDNIAC